jgi:GT2 family glycosyltransferase
MTSTRCSIVIPVHNKSALTRQCLDAIFDSPPAVEHEVLVVDDASTDDTSAMLAAYGDAVRQVRLEQNAGFATACNMGAAAAQADHLVFLNNDTIPQPGWLDALVGYADRYAVAAVGSKLLLPDGTVQHAGVVFGFQGDPLHIYAGCPADHPAVSKSRRFQAVTAACMLIRRDTFEQAGGFDTGYHNDLEDVDLCLRLGELGQEVHYCHESVLYHLESASRGPVTQPRPSARVYRERWGRRVRHDELLYYLEDGLLDVVRLPPDQVGIDDGKRLRELELIHARMIQLLQLLRETVLLSMYAPPRADGATGAQRVPLRTRRRIEKRLTELRQLLAAEMSQEAAHAQGEPDAVPQVAPVLATSPVSAPVETVTDQAFDGPAAAQAAATAEPAAATEESAAEAERAYTAVVERLRDRLGAALPAGTTVAVASRGDEKLVTLPGRTGMHFPRGADGRHLGHHPETGTDAARHVEEVRAQGAEYLVFPETERWWLDYYEALKERLLGSHIEVLDEPGVGVVFELAERPVTELVCSLVPAGSKLAVATPYAADLAGLGSRRPVWLPTTLGDAAAVDRLERLRATGVRYLVVPHHTFAWLESRPGFTRRLEVHDRFVTRRRHAAIWELAPVPAPDVAAPHPPVARRRSRRRGFLLRTRSR